MEEQLIIDPPNGWRYGFPKPYFKLHVNDLDELRQWLVSEGYPQSEIDLCGNYFPVRYWMQKD